MDIWTIIAAIAIPIAVLAGLVQILGISLRDVIKSLQNTQRGRPVLAGKDLLAHVRTLIKRGQYSAASELLIAYRASRPDDYRVMSLLGIADAGCDRYEKALRCLAEAIALGDPRSCTRLNYAALKALVDYGPPGHDLILEETDENGRAEIKVRLLRKPGTKDEVTTLIPPPMERVDIPAMQPQISHFGIMSNVQVKENQLTEYLSAERLRVLAERVEEMVSVGLGQIEGCKVFVIEDESLLVSGQSCDAIFATAVGTQLRPRCKSTYILKHNQGAEWLRQNSGSPLIYCSFSALNIPYLYKLLLHTSGAEPVAVISVLGPDKNTMTSLYQKPPWLVLFPLDQITLPPLGGLCH